MVDFSQKRGFQLRPGLKIRFFDVHSNSVFECNHEEADTRMIYHASLQGGKNAVLVANDSDVMFLGIHACTLAGDRHWYYNYMGTAYANLAKMSDFYGENAKYLLLFHCLTGCDTTSYYYFKGKSQPWERALKSPSSFLLLRELGKTEELSQKGIDDCVEFVRHIVYSGRKGNY